MKSTVLLGAIGAAGAVIALGQVSDGTPADQARIKEKNAALAAEIADPEMAALGGNPDVIVFKISGTANYGPTGGLRAYSVGTTSCNIGTDILVWQAGNNQHPVIGQSMFRAAPGQNGHIRFEQLGQSWLKHGFCALDLNECGNCQGTGCSSLGIGCSDPYTASRNGSQSSAGPKWQVNATTGFFPYPPANPSYSGSMARRMQVPLSDVEAASNPGARYFVDAQYVTPDDNPSVDLIRAANNASYREMNLSSSGSLSGYIGETRQQQPGIYAWREVDPQVKISWMAVTGMGSAFIGSRAYDNGNGTWDYEYAVQNLDIDRSIGKVSIPVDPSVVVTAPGFHDVHYHSNDGLNNVTFDGTDWAYTREADGRVVWQTVQTFASNPNGNAIRWGNLFNFRYTANSGPSGDDGFMALSFFKDGAGPASANAAIVVPQSADFCLGDFDQDGTVGFSDLVSLLSEWGFCFNCAQDFDGNFDVNFEDLLTFLSLYGPCP